MVTIASQGTFETTLVLDTYEIECPYLRVHEVAWQDARGKWFPVAIMKEEEFLTQARNFKVGEKDKQFYLRGLPTICSLFDKKLHFWPVPDRDLRIRITEYFLAPDDFTTKLAEFVTGPASFP